MSIEKILKYIIYTGIFGILLTPFIVSQSMFFPFITGKNFFFRIIVGIIVGAWLILAVRNREYRPKKSWLLWSFVAFLIWMAISNLLSPNSLKSFWSNFERMEGWVTLLHLFGYFIVVGTMLNSKKLWTKFLNSSVAVSIILAVYSFFQLAGVIVINQGGVRVDATFGNATYLAVYMLFHIFITVFLLAERSRQRRIQNKKAMDWVNWLYIPAILLQIIVLYYTATRGAILGLIGGVILTFVLIAVFEKDWKALRKFSVSALVAIFLLVGGFFVIKDSSFVKNSQTLSRFSSISLNDKTTQSRFIIWGMALEGFKEKPVFGWGQESFNYVFNSNYDPQMFSQESWFDRAHNVFFDWLVAGGAVGLLLYLSLFGWALYYLWKRKEDENLSIASKAIFTGLLAGYFFHNLFVFDNVVSYILFFSILAYIYSQRVSQTNEDKLRVVSGSFQTIIAPLLITILAVFSIYSFNAKGILASQSLLDGLRNVSLQNYDQGLEDFSKAISYNNYAKQETREQLAQTATALANSQVPLEIKQKYFNLATAEMLAQVEEDPENARMEVFLGALFSRYGIYDEAIAHLERALELSPNKQNIMLELGSNYINKGSYEKGTNVLKDAFNLAPEYNLARMAYAMGLIYVGDNNTLEELLVPEYGTVIVPNDFLIKAYFDTGQKDKVIALREAKVLESPENIQARFSLSAAYLDAGRRTDAIQTLEGITTIAPQHEDQVDYYIGEIRAGRNP